METKKRIVPRKMSMPLGLCAIKVIHHGWAGVVGASLGLELNGWGGKWSYLPSGITLISYIIFDRRCVFSMLETYYYPDIYPHGYNPVSTTRAIAPTVLTLAGIYFIRNTKDNTKKWVYYSCVLTLVLALNLSPERKLCNYFSNLINIPPVSQYLF